MLNSAIQLLASGLSVLPARRDQKRPALSGWKSFQKKLPTRNQIQNWFSSDVDALCIVTGTVSGNLELVDFDFSAELFDAWSDQIPLELRQRLFIERSQSGGRHVVYRCEHPICGNLKLAQDRRDGKIVTLIETRGEGGLFLCHPTVGYEIEQGSLNSLPVITADDRDQLLAAAWQLNRIEDESKLASNIESVGDHVLRISDGDLRPGDDYNQRGDITQLLKSNGWIAGATLSDGNQHWTRPGKSSGTSATLKDRVFYVFSANAAPLQNGKSYSPFGLYAALQHSDDFETAARTLAETGFGSPIADIPPTPFETNLIKTQPSKATASTSSPTSADPGRLPEHMFRVPGFIERVMDFTLANAPYPNIGLAFCGAIALQSFLAGRKVCTSGDLRTNLYLLALASSGTGKEFPRKVNSQVLHQIGMSASVGDKFASGEGIQDALIRTGCMLFQNDEMDGVLRQINLDRDNSRESIPNILLTLYTSASDVYPTRVKAGQKEALHVDQPHLTLFGTATPQHFYESLSRRMLTNGFFARLNIIDVGRRGPGQKSGSARQLPDSILETAKWWAQFEPGSGNFLNFHPAPRVVPFDDDAEAAIDDLRLRTETEYNVADADQDEVARTAWSRTCEHATKLALIYAVSEKHEQPVIRLPAVEWATEFAMHQTRRQLFLAGVHVADNPFHADCLKLIKKLRESPVHQMQRRELMRAMHWKAKDFDAVVQTLQQQGDLMAVEIATATRPAQGYQLI